MSLVRSSEYGFNSLARFRLLRSRFAKLHYAAQSLLIALAVGVGLGLVQWSLYGQTALDFMLRAVATVWVITATLKSAGLRQIIEFLKAVIVAVSVCLVAVFLLSLAHHFFK